jgi:flagellum-specific peptidoglycan hydrolase FlgJ
MATQPPQSQPQLQPLRTEEPIEQTHQFKKTQQPQPTPAIEEQQPTNFVLENLNVFIARPNDSELLKRNHPDTYQQYEVLTRLTKSFINTITDMVFDITQQSNKIPFPFIK